jgi:hypothetical protein
MLSKGFCEFDADFCEKDVVNTSELSFADYENGCLLEDNSEKRDSWLPSPLLSTATRKVTFNDIPIKSPVYNKRNLTKSPEQNPLSESVNFSSPLSTSTTIQQEASMKLARAEPSARTNRPRDSPRLKLDEEVLSGVSSSTSYTPTIRTNVRENFNREPLNNAKAMKNEQKSSKVAGNSKTGNDQAGAKHKSQLKSNVENCNRKNESTLRQVVHQKLNVFDSSETLRIYIHSITESIRFYFFLESEFSDLAEFFRAFK